VVSLVSAASDAALGARVPACPAWSVRDVVAHLTAVAEDVVAGRLAGPPSDDETAAQVARFAGRDVTEILARWASIAPRFEYLIGRSRVRAAVIDIASHEHDIRGAIGRPGARDAAAVWHSAEWLLAGLRPAVPLLVIVEDAQFRLGPGSGTELSLTTSRFEAFRWRMGRRSAGQLAALDWSGDPAPVIGHLVVFGPAAHDVVE
jgi:uncharacterized protein (TIGR03083 family)